MIRFLLIIQLLISAIGFTAVQEAENTQKIGEIMKELFQKHVDKKEMNLDLIKAAYRNYIEQFDPNHVYLLQSEVAPFINMDQSTASMRLAEYKSHHFTGFEELNEVIQHAIQRARSYRKSLLKNPSQFAQTAKSGVLPSHQGKETFALNIAELQNRIRGQIDLFLREERNRLGDTLINDNLAKTLGIYEEKTEEQEDQYLPSALVSKKAGSVQQSELLTLHILKALSASLDPHTDVLDDSEAYSMRMRLEKSYRGIGIEVEKQGNAIVIAKLVPQGPAEKSGDVKVNDRIVSINNQPTADMSLDQILTALREGTNSVVYLELQPEGHGTIKQVKLKREQIPINTGRVESAYEKFGNGIIGIVVLHSFYKGTGDVSSEKDLRNAIEQLQHEGNLRGLILDLRDNTGGFLTEAIKVAGLFIRSGIVVISKYSNGETEVFRDVNGKVAYDGPLVILISRETASAAEIVAEALQDYGKAIIVGDEHSYGKGTIQSQTVTNQNEHALFKVTVGKYYTVSGKSPQLQGVKADIVVPGPLNKVKIGEAYYEDAETAKPIPPEYNDNLSDIPAIKREWYKEYYLPTLQKHVTQWQDLIPTLSKNSAHRLKNNKDYQQFLTSANKLDSDILNNPALSQEASLLQLEEAINIIKDMVTLEAQERGGG